MVIVLVVKLYMCDKYCCCDYILTVYTSCSVCDAFKIEKGNLLTRKALADTVRLIAVSFP